MDGEEDAREVELSTIAAIYPELQIDENDPHRVLIELPISLASPLTVRFPASTEAAPPVAPLQPLASASSSIESQELLNLPALKVQIVLPDGYPQQEPPNVTISTSPPWLSGDILQKLEHNAQRLWEDIGRDQVIFTYIDDLQRHAEEVFGLVDGKGILDVGPEHKIAILDYDNNAKRKAFERETFDCGICLDPKKGAVCHRMLDCGHVFCRQCLQDFYNNAITEGDVASVQCLQPNCAKEREDALRALSKKKRKPRTFISPSELLQIPIDQEMVKRYVDLKHKTELESDKNTVYCPRSWCQGAARSKKHKKPEGLELVEGSDDDSEEEDSADKKKFKAGKELLAICEDCGFAFCTRCDQSWHGEFKYCIPKERKDEITEEEKASLEYLKMHTTPCPTCAAPCQKTHGCNHMLCFRCQTHFCYLCSAWLDPSNPYRHFNIQPSGETNGCFMRLWELEGGDGGEIGAGFEGGNARRDANAQAGQIGQPLEVLELGPEDDDVAFEEFLEDPDPDPDPDPRGQPPLAADHPPPRQQPNGRAAVALEAPLVLRIEGGAVPAPRQGAARRQPDAAPANAPAPAGRAANGAQRRGRGNRRGRGVGENRQNNRQYPLRPRNRNHQIELEQDDPPQGENQLDPGQEAWVRHFVHLALIDQEHLM
ncbi:RWD domain-containing protein [Xylariomycetidae sp. FL0641]|nr:RWD domain-containing protein [Xylariomycetidae sp. FL0641]